MTYAMPTADDDLAVAGHRNHVTPFCGGNATPADVHLSADIVAVDGEIVEWLARRERRRDR